MTQILKIDTPTITFAEIKAERAARDARAAESGLFARIRKDSQYAGQDDSTFPVAIYSDGEYIVHGGRGGRYRLSDVDLFWSNGAGELFPVRKGKY